MVGCMYLDEDSLHDVLLHVMRTTSCESSSWTYDSSGALAVDQARPSGSDSSRPGSSNELRASSPVGFPLDEVGGTASCGHQAIRVPGLLVRAGW